MITVVALGGNALLRRDEPPEAAIQEAHVREAAGRLARVIGAASPGERFVLTHGNGPQVGLLARQAQQDPQVAPYPLDWLDAESEGMIGYLIERELRNELPEREIATLLTQVAVSPQDPAFGAPSKPIGQVVGDGEAERLRETFGWTMAREDEGWRRVVASPEPRSILGLANVRALLGSGAIVVCAGGGGVPVASEAGSGAPGRLRGVEAVIDKDRVSARLAMALDARTLWLLTDVDAVYERFGEPDARALERLGSDEVDALELPAGSMAPKAAAAALFARATGREAVIGSLDHVESLATGHSGTRIVP